MSIRGPRRSQIIPSNFKYRFGLTHFIYLPLLNKNSSSQVQETLWQVANDPVSAAVPPLAYQKLQQLKISIVALSLPTQESRSQATALLQDLGNRDWPKIFSKSQAASSNPRISSNMNQGRLTNGFSDEIDPRPLIVSAFFDAISSQPIARLNLKLLFQSV